MPDKNEDAKALKPAKSLKNADNWKSLARPADAGYYELQTEDTGSVPVRLFFTKNLLDATEDILYRHQD
jgi:tRNA-splicing ligase RtcB